MRLSTLDRDLNGRIAIIGGGISGALMAYCLMREGMHVVLIDCRQSGEGENQI